MKYRADIDGLRAVAVLPVVLFHLGLASIVPGGFVGVDVFFVISGFLITRIIYDGVQDGDYSVIDFYAKRVRRIFPALYAVYAFVVGFSFLFLFPSEVSSIGKSLLSSIFFVSNIFFYYSSGYFDQGVESNPLLHTWSLSVEEQFYVLFPLVVYALRSVTHRLRVMILCGVGLLSLFAAEWVVRSDQMLAFYTVFFRAWELLLGGVLALCGEWRVRSKLLVNGVSIVGVGLLLVGYLGLTKASLFPGFSALAPCLGAAAIIYSGQGSIIGRVLSIKAFSFVGLVSYSLYLWHWPVMVFWKHFREPNGVVEKMLVLAVCFGMAVLSWRFIERPFRKSDVAIGPRRIVLLGGFVLCGGAAVVIASILLSPYLRAVPPEAERMLAFSSYDASDVMRSGQCFLTSSDKNVDVFDRKRCLALSGNQPNVLIVGDSHAAHLWYGLSSSYGGINFLQATASGCKPVLNSTGERRCTDLISYVFESFLAANRVDAVIISGRWKKSDVDKVLETAAWLKGKVAYVYIAGPIVEYDQALPRVLAQGLLEGGDLAMAAESHRSLEPKVVDQLFARQALPEGVQYLSSFDALCAQGCRLTDADGGPIQFDYGHLTAQGSAYLAGSSIFRGAMDRVARGGERGI